MTSPAATTERFGATLEYLDAWLNGLTPARLDDLLQEFDARPEQVVLLSADLVVGFCSEGTLASPRIGGIVPAAVELVRGLHQRGVRNFVFFQDTHHHRTPEFQAYPPHCIEGTEEAEMVEELRELEFADQFTIFRKNSLHPAIGTGFDRWLDEHPDLRMVIAVGDCSDLCLYQTAMYPRLRANAKNQDLAVVVPENCVQTYELPFDVARETGAQPHDGDFYHMVFLHHLALNGVRVVSRIEA